MRKAEIRREGGRARVYVDDEPRVPIALGLSDIPGAAANTAYAQKNIASFARAGVHMVMIDVELRDGWHKVSPFEWEPMQEEIAAALQADPESAVLIRFHLNPPYWWMRDNMEENVIYEDGTHGVDDGEMLRLIRDDHNHRVRVSLASEKWLREAGENLRLFCENVWDTPEGHAVLAIQAACGLNGEWHQWGVDQSEPMKRRFHRYLKEKYGTDEKLRQAWGDPEVTIESAPFCPDPAQPGTDGIFRDPVQQRKIMDAQYVTQMVVPEAILYFNRIVKESWGRPVLTGAFYGYYIGTGGDRAPIEGHLLPDLLYEHPETVDFLSGPFPYMQNRLPEGVPLQRGHMESNRLRGMLWLTETDERPAGLDRIPGGDPARIGETIAMLRRSVLQPVLAGQGLWYYDHRAVAHSTPGCQSSNPLCCSIFRKVGWWENSESLAEIGRLQKLADTLIRRDYVPAADVLVVFSTESHFATSRFVNEEYPLLEAVARTGAAYDCIYLKELEIAEMERYRCVIFANAYELNEAQRDRIRRLAGEKQVMFLYAPGYSDGKSLNTGNLEAVTGIHVKRIPPEPGYRSLLSGQEYSVDPWEYTPFFAVEDTEAERIAEYTQSGCAAIARKGNVWYSACPRLDPDTARALIRESGAHVYTGSGDPVIAGDGILLLYTRGGGRKTVTLRGGKRVEMDLAPMTSVILDADSGTRLE